MSGEKITNSYLSNPMNIFWTSLISGGLAGTFVDVTLYPLDTLKTRLQSQHGFQASGGFSKLYKGITPVILGSAPTAALFFVTYESIKMFLIPKVDERHLPFVHMTCASIAEVVSCLIRVPVEVSKQRKQAMITEVESFNIRLLYRGFWSTVLRDMPFSLVQFSTWEYLKQLWKEYSGRVSSPYQGAICGALAGAISAAITTPLDVTKTRIMLAKKFSTSSELRISRVLSNIYKENGIRGFFAGLGPRVAWITLGGFIFFGVYEKSKFMLSSAPVQVRFNDNS